MTPAEWLIAAKIAQAVLVGILIPGSIWLWKVYRDRVRNQELKEFIDTIVREAEEKGESRAIDKSKKLDFVWNKIEDRYPWTKKKGAYKFIDSLVHAAINFIDAGASSSSKK